MRIIIINACRGKATTGETLCSLLERRLDNVIFRADFAQTIAAARQLMNHRHVLRNSKLSSIASMRLKTWGALTLNGRSVQLALVLETMNDMPLSRPEWLGWDIQTQQAEVMHLPEAEDAPFPVDMQPVVGHHANRL